MKIAIATTSIPLVPGGAQYFVEWLRATLENQGHHVDVVNLPQVDSPKSILKQMMAFRWIDLEDADLLICTRPQSHLIPHRNKVVWFIHHIRAFYDLWGTEYRGFPDNQETRTIREEIVRADTNSLKEAIAVYTNSKIVSDRLRNFNGVEGKVLYPPIYKPERFTYRGQNNTIACICRVEKHKRQHVLIEAMRHSTSDVTLDIHGKSSDKAYSEMLRKMISSYKLESRVKFTDEWLSEEEKERVISECLGLVYMPFDEDSYGYPSLEASHACKPIFTMSDSGGVLELVTNRENGIIADTPEELGAAFDELFLDRLKAREMGKKANNKISLLDISWERVIRELVQ